MDSVRVILQAVNERNLELAQRTVDLEVLKNPLSDVYLTLKVYVAFKRNDSKQALDTAAKAVTVCSKKTLEMFLIPVLVEYHASDLLASAFVKVNRQDPSDHEICEAWLESSLMVGDLSSAQKALMAMQRTTKKPRSVCYQACYIMAIDNSNSKLFPVLAERMISKYLPAKTPQECFVVALVYKMVSSKKMVDYLLENGTFDAFVVGTLDLQILLLNGLLDTEQWEKLFEYAKTQLNRIDSYNYWQAINTAAVELGKTEEVLALASSFTSNNSLLAQIDLHSKIGNEKSLANAIVQYWTENGSKPSTYKYLKSYINNKTIDLVKPHETSLGMKINYAKFRSLLKNPLSFAELVEIYEMHLGAAPAEKTDYFMGTDALIIISQSLLRQKDLEFNREMAATVLEHSLAVDPHNFNVRVLLIQIYQSLGAMTIAIKHFDSLSIRNIQLETLGFLLSTRVGSVSPESATLLLAKLRMSYDKIPNFGVFSMASLTEGSFTQFEGIFNLGQKLSRSLSRCLLNFEQIHAARINRGSINSADTHRIPDPDFIVDNRDFDITSLDDGTEPVTDILHVGPKQGKDYIKIQKSKEITLQDASSFPSSSASDLATIVEKSDRCDELTEIEKWNVRCIQKLAANGKSAVLEEPPTFETTKPLDWELFHWCNTVIETAKVARSMKCNLKISPQALIKSWVTGYQSQLNSWEPKVNAAFRESNLPGDASRVVRAIKQEHMAKLKGLLEI